mgnify:FL=1
MIKRYLLSLALMLLFVPSLAQAWWSEEWPYRVKVNVNLPADNSAQNAADDRTVLLRLHTGNFQDFFYFKEDVGDLRFIAGDDKTPLKHHVEKFDLINQMMFVWVKLPQLSGADQQPFVYMYYGNDKAVSAEDSGGSFDVNRSAVFHFAGHSNVVIDASAYSQKATLNNIERQPASLIGAGISLQQNGFIQVQPSASLQYLAGKGFAFSAWIKPQGAQDDAWLLRHQTSMGNLTLGIEQSGLYAQWQSADGDIFRTPATAPLTPDSWQQVALNLDAQRLAVFVNGIEMASVQVKIPSFMAGDLFIGGAPQGHGFVGEMDEVDMSAASRAPGWFAFKVTAQGQQSQLLSLTQAEQLGGSSSESYFAVVLGNVSLDGWIVIGLLMMMAAISWLVMVAKAMMLNRMARDNQTFVNDFRKVSIDNPGELDAPDEEDEFADSPMMAALFGKHDHYQSSPLYHLYHQGIGELNQRVGKSVGARANNALTPQAISAIRAVLDASLVRESQKLNGKMVLLTIAISGGPFLGLLGTVLGVMITFAAIAASGDVNINAIAPGVSAALMTTVAGLFVAIPALFGYNYLSVRIKDMMSDMHVFVDEFITRVAEMHS